MRRFAVDRENRNKSIQGWGSLAARRYSTCIPKWMLRGLIAFGAAGAAQADGPRLGLPASRAVVKPWDISIAPDGTGLLSGRGTVAQGRSYSRRSARPATDRLEPVLPQTADGQCRIAPIQPPYQDRRELLAFATILFDYVQRGDADSAS